MMWIAIIIIIILALMGEDEAKIKRAQDNQVVGYNIMNGRPILRKHVNITGYDTKTGQPLFEYKKPIIGYNPHNGEPIFEGEEMPIAPMPKEPMTQEEKTRLSNTILMIAGAALVVIASIIFLATGWETMHGLIKTIILVGIQMIFYLFGYISNNKLNIPKIGKMFNYLTLAFVPIIVLSLSFFELVGDYFSIGCEGFTYFIGISLLISDVVYKVYGYSKQDNFSKRSSLVVEALAILFITSNFNLMYVEAFALIVHAIIIYMLLQGGFLDKNAYSKITDIYTVILLLIAAIPTQVEVNIMSFTNLLLLALSFFVRCLNVEKDSEKKPNLVLFFISYLLSIRIIEQVEISPYFLYLLSLLPIIGLIKVVNTESMKKNIVRVVGILTVAITSFAMLNPEQSIYYLFAFIIATILSLIVYLLTKTNFYKLWTYVSFTVIFFCTFYIAEITEIAKYILLIVPIIIYAIETIYEELKDNTTPLFIIGALSIETLILTGVNTMIIPLVLLTIYLVLENRKEEIVVPMLGALLLVSLETQALVNIVFISLTLIYVFFSIRKENFNKYTVFSIINIFILCIYNEVNTYTLWSTLLVWGILHYLLKETEKKEIYLTAIIFSIFGLYMKTLNELDSTLYANIALGIIFVAISMTKGVFKKSNPETIGVIECIIIGLLTLVGSIAIQEPTDGVVYLAMLLVLSILAYIKEWKYYLYSSIVSMIFGVIILTAEYWQQIPWYVYILFIGLSLIIFAMYDEKRKQNKRLAAIQQEQQAKEQPIIIPAPVVVEEQIIEQAPTEEPVKENIIQEESVKEAKITPKIKVVEDTSSKIETTKENQNATKTGARKSTKPKYINKNRQNKNNK